MSQEVAVIPAVSVPATGRFLITLAAALAGGAVASALHCPIPWMLGPMFATLLLARLQSRIVPCWPAWLRHAALVAIGYSVGLSFTADTIAEMGRQLPTMLLMNVLLLLFSGGIAYAVARLAGVSLATALLGSVPGGLSQMIVLGEETRGANLTVIAFLQVTRLMMVIVSIPFLIFSSLFGNTHRDGPAIAGSVPTIAGLFPGIVWFMLVCVPLALLANRFKVPAAFMLGPMLATVIVQMSGLSGPALPETVLDGAQLLLGAYVGLLLQPANLPKKPLMFALAAGSGLVLIVGSLGLSMLMFWMHDVSPSTALLAMSPGGMDQMSLIAGEIRADSAIVGCYQMFRLWIIFFAVTPLLRLLLRRFIPKEVAA